MKTETNQPAEVPTPRTAAFTDKMRAEYFPHALGGTPYIKTVAFACELERENIALLDTLRKIAHGEYDNAHDCMFAAKIARAAIKSATEEGAP